MSWLDRQTTLVVPPVGESSPMERGETKVVNGLSQELIDPTCSRKGVERWWKLHRKLKAPYKIKILPHVRAEAALDRTQPHSTGVKLNIY